MTGRDDIIRRVLMRCRLITVGENLDPDLHKVTGDLVDDCLATLQEQVFQLEGNIIDDLDVVYRLPFVKYCAGEAAAELEISETRTQRLLIEGERALTTIKEIYARNIPRGEVPNEEF